MYCYACFIQGLIRSKTLGGNIATGSVIVFLDAHVKPDPGWVFPILRNINTNYKRVVVPKIPILNGTTWEVNRKAGKSSRFNITKELECHKEISKDLLVNSSLSG